jgi:hypothetical protein
MKATFISKLTTLIVATLFVFVTSCQNEDPVRPYSNTKFTIKPLTDPKIIAEIQAMVAAGASNSQGRTAVTMPAVPLPPGYNYSSMQEVTISGTSWVTYLAYSTTVNTPTSKEMISLYYQGGVFKNYLLNKWEKQTIRLRDGSTETFIHSKHKFPPNVCISKPWDIHTVLEPATNESSVQAMMIYPPGQCGQSVMDCLDDFYTGHGWASLGFTMAAALSPSFLAGSIGGCMLGCMIHGPTSFICN